MALLLALARNVPQAHGALTQGRWERKNWSGTELMGKTLGILGFGRIGQLVAHRAKAFDMEVIAYDPFVATELYRSLKVQRADGPDDVYAAADFLSLHMPTTDETNGMIDAAAFAKMRDGVRILNVARGSLIVDEDLKDAVDSGKVGGAALDVFRSEPMTDHPLFGYPERRRHAAPRRLDRRGHRPRRLPGRRAGRRRAAGRQRHDGGQRAVDLGRGSRAAQPVSAAVQASSASSRPSLAACGSVDKIEIECHGRIGERDTGPLGIAVVLGALGGRTEDSINAVNALSIAKERGIDVVQSRSSSARDYTDLVRVAVWCGGKRQNGVVGTTIGSKHRPHLLAAWGQRFNLQLEPYLTLFRYRDVPGIIGQVGMTFGAHGINIGSAAVGHTPPTAEGDRPAVMIVTTDSQVPQPLIDELLADRRTSSTPGRSRCRRA